MSSDAGDFVSIGPEEEREVWLHWARQPFLTREEASALLSGIFPGECRNLSSRTQMQAKFGAERTFRYSQNLQLLEREIAVWRLMPPITIEKLLDWARLNKIPVEPKFVEAFDEISSHRASVELSGKPHIEASNRPGEPLGTRERDSLLTLIGAMAIRKYGYHPDKRSNAVSEIKSDISELCLGELSEDTIRSKLKEACDLVPQSVLKKLV